MKKTFISLFGGIGGFDLPLTNQGWECKGYYEIDKYAVQVYNDRFKTKYEPTDIRVVRTSDIPEHTMLCGGFPCQAFSIAGKRMGFEDTRGTLFFEIARIVKKRRPQIVLLENVKGLLSHDNRRTFTTILATLDELGYDAEWQVVNSKHYGVPQNRERIFIIGHIRGGSGRQIFPLTEDAGQVHNLPEGQDPRMIGCVEQTYHKRTHDTPSEINQYLKDNKGNHTIQGVTDYLGLPKSQVEHYFRTDTFRAIPLPEVWIKLKELLRFDDKYDKQVTEIFEKEIEYEQSRRVYDSQGINPTLNATKENIVYDRKGFDSRTKGFRAKEGESPCLSTKMGTGGNNVPMIVQNHQDARQGRKPLREYNETSPTLRAKMGDTQPMVVAQRQRDRHGKQEEHIQQFEARTDVANTITNVQKDNYIYDGYNKRFKDSQEIGAVRTKQGCGTTGNSISQNAGKLRRLTPVECERLQGFPDNWTSAVSDTQRYKQLGNAVTVNVVDTIVRKINEVNKVELV